MRKLKPMFLSSPFKIVPLLPITLWQNNAVGVSNHTRIWGPKLGPATSQVLIKDEEL